MLPTLRTDRLVLRPLIRSDAGPMEHFASDAGVAYMLTRVPHPYPKGEARAFVDEVLSVPEERTHLRPFAVACDGAFAGIVAIADVTTPRADNVTLGYWLGRPYWRRGYMTEAVHAVLADYVFGQLSARRVFAGAFADNPGSLAVLRRSGFRKVGVSMKHSLARGCAAPHVDFELTPADFTGARP
jgi:ribosomal-protein-alanine N-acetyltransferase